MDREVEQCSGGLALPQFPNLQLLPVWAPWGLGTLLPVQCLEGTWPGVHC